jgi:D-alanyl-D-alanine carboxypeptidase (penicillin-binding protein 5/6)
MFCRLPIRILTLGALLTLGVSCVAEPPRRRPSGPPPPPVQPVRTEVGAQLPIPPNPPPAVLAESAIVVDAASGRVLYAKNADVRRPVASTQKILTALCVLEAGDIDHQVVIQAEDGRCEPTKLYLKPGERYARRDLLKVLMVKSANDVAWALARDAGGSLEGFAAMMNRKAASLGMRNSNFVLPCGLPRPGQYSTARDMAIAARAALRSPLLRSYANTREFVFQYNDGRTRKLENTNKLLKTLPYCTGLKTGTTNEAGRCLVATGTLNGSTAIVVVLKSNSSRVWKDSAGLLRWALERPVPAAVPAP